MKIKLSKSSKINRIFWFSPLFFVMLATLVLYHNDWSWLWIIVADFWVLFMTTSGLLFLAEFAINKNDTLLKDQNENVK